MKLVNDSGQTLIEVVIVITVGVFVIGALVFATISSLRNSQFSKNQAQATKLAQAGLEKVRSARDRGAVIGGTLVINGKSIDSWNPDLPTPGNSGLWTQKLSDGCVTPNNCYFKFIDSSFQFAESAPDIGNSYEDPLGDGKFKRVVILSDDPTTFQDRKKVTVIVRWSDFAGNHESRLTSILGKL